MESDPNPAASHHGLILEWFEALAVEFDAIQ